MFIGKFEELALEACGKDGEKLVKSTNNANIEVKIKGMRVG
jgi:hypothetical protein